jgi:hypothetical protein
VAGLAEYLEGVHAVTAGRELRVQSVVKGWSDGAKATALPALVVYSAGRGGYGTDQGASPMGGGGLRPDDRIGTTNTYARSPCAFSQALTAELWCANAVERRVLARAMEDALVAPTPFMYGFRLVLPHYHGAHATYELNGSERPDDEDSAQQRKRLVTFSLTATVPLIVLTNADGVRIRPVHLEVDGAEV